LGLCGTDFTDLQKSKEVLGASSAFAGWINTVAVNRERERVATPEIALFLVMGSS
jgi:hypothetical protein